MGESDASSSDEEDVNIYLIHNAAEAGNVEAVATLLASEEGLSNSRVRDVDSCTPLHLTLLHGHLDVARAILEINPNQVSSRCEGSLPLHMVASIAALPTRHHFCIRATELLLTHGASPLDRDDHGRLPLHWAAASEHADLVDMLLSASRAAAEKPSVAEDGTNLAPPFDGKPITEVRDKQGNTALHLAARTNSHATVSLLLQDGGAAAAHVKNNEGQVPLHLATKANSWQVAAALLKADFSTSTIEDLRGLTAQQWAAKRGHQALANALLSPDMASSNGAEHEHGPTVLVAPEDCYLHNTIPLPIIRGGRSPPPENVNRLHVLTNSDLGILRGTEFEGLQWETQAPLASMSDVLRVHEWSYVRELQNLCATLGDNTIGHLDGDTAVSSGSFKAALAAAGAVIRAVDQVVGGKARNAFCAVRPPGHHAGPTGIVTCANDPHGSHGFCLFSNLAIGAAYAMSQHRSAGIKRVALLDFDVHHGNGTQACIGNTVPSLATYAFLTPLSKGSQIFPQYKPWLDFSDAENILFASVQGYGNMEGRWFYPGSGATSDTRPPPPRQSHASGVGAAEPSAAAAGTTQGGTADDSIVEDPDGEFSAASQEASSSSALRMINVGIPGPGGRVSTWRRAWRDKILPAVVRFQPDIIFVSAGFDAHRKDVLNNRFVGLHEKDYEWLTGHIVQVANRCCKGRIVSVLEGGYRIQGKIVSAFARSVAAHVRALLEPNHQIWDPEDGRWERDYERQQKLKAEAAKQAAIEAEAQALKQRLAALAAAQEDPAKQSHLGDPLQQPDGDMPGVEHDRKRRRRSGPVDYKALDERLRAEHSHSSSVPPLQQQPPLQLQPTDAASTALD